MLRGDEGDGVDDVSWRRSCWRLVVDVEWGKDRRWRGKSVFEVVASTRQALQITALKCWG